MPDRRNGCLSCKLPFATLAVTILLIAGQQVLGADGAAKASPPKAAKRKAVGGRLPPHYSAVVTQGQREKIYAVQREYQPKIKALQARIDALKKDRDQKISSVLTEEQRQRIEQAGGKVFRPEAETLEDEANEGLETTDKASQSTDVLPPHSTPTGKDGDDVDNAT